MTPDRTCSRAVRTGWRIVTLAGLFVAVSLATRWLSLAIDLLDMDEAAHIVGSWTLMRGAALYTAFVDNKPPLLYSYYAAAQHVLGRGLVPVHAFTAMVTVPVTALGVAAYFNYTRRGLTAGLIFLAYSSAFLAHDMLAAHGELIMLAPGSWALVFVRNREYRLSAVRGLAAGALIGLGTLVGVQLIAWLPALVWAILSDARPQRRHQRAMRAAAAVCAGTASPIAAAALWFAVQGRLDDLIRWTVAGNIAYARTLDLSEALRRAAATIVPFGVVTAPLWWAAWRGRRLPESASEQPLIRAVLVCSIPPLLAGGRFFPHYLVQLYVPLALAAAPWIAAQLGSPFNRSLRWIAVHTAAVMVFSQALNAWLYLGPSRVYSERDPVYQRVAERLRLDACAPRATMFVWGYAPAFYYFAALTPASRFVVLPQAGLTGYRFGNLAQTRRALPPDRETAHANWPVLLRDLDESHATYVIDTSPAGIYRWNLFPLRSYPRLAEYVELRYDRLPDVDGVRLYRRRGCLHVP